MTRLGPAIEFNCSGCHYHKVERYRVQGDSGYEHYCSESSAVEFASLTRGDDGYIGDTTGGKSPDWCPLRTVALLAFVEAENARSKEPK